MKKLAGSLMIVLGLSMAGFLNPIFVSSQSLSLPMEIASAGSAPADSTGKNVRDKNDATLTPIDQSEGSEHDVELTRRLREALTADETLSTDAHNIKIVTLNGKTTLRGPVKNVGDQERILKKANKIVGMKNVDNQLEVANP